MIKNENVNLNFHSTFNPDFEYITKILEIADEYEGLTKEEISDLTGIPTGKSSGKVEPHIMYCKYMNLINFKKKDKKYYINSTELGKVVRLEDLYFLENITKLICHYFLTSKISGAVLWSKIFRDMQYKYGNKIKEGIVIRELEEEFNIKIKVSPFNSCYTHEKSLASLNLVKLIDLKEDKIISFNKNIYDEDALYVYAFTLIKELEELDQNRKEFSINEIIYELKWNQGFCWDENMAIEVLEKINDKSIINLNRQLNPMTVIINKSSEDILDSLYSLLF